MAFRHGLLCFIFWPGFLQSATFQYNVKVNVDLANHVIHGQESIQFTKSAGVVSLEKPAGLTVEKSASSTGKITVADASIEDGILRGGKQVVEFEYSAKDARGLHWIAGQPGLSTTFFCSAWMVCSMAPDQRASLKLEIVVNGEGYRAVGPGIPRRNWRDAAGEHWTFETPAPVQTYLFSFAVARLQSSGRGPIEILAPDSGHESAWKQTEAAAAFFRQKTGMDPIRSGYREVFLPQAGLFGQEAAQFAMLTQPALTNLESRDDVVLIAHELAHQWWGVSIGIRSWSDFWLNEGVAEYVSLLYLEHVRGTPAFLAEIEKLKAQLKQLTRSAPDRPLHFEAWMDSNDALGQLPYVKGALFLHELRSRMGDESFWQAMARYSRLNQGKLVDSSDFQKVFEATSKVDLDPLFRKEVYGVGR